MGERFSPGFSVSTEDQESLTSRLSPLAKHSWQLSLRLGGSMQPPVFAPQRLRSPLGPNHQTLAGTLHQNLQPGPGPSEPLLRVERLWLVAAPFPGRAGPGGQGYGCSQPQGATHEGAASLPSLLAEQWPQSRGHLGLRSLGLWLARRTWRRE